METVGNKPACARECALHWGGVARRPLWQLVPTSNLRRGVDLKGCPRPWAPSLLRPPPPPPSLSFAVSLRIPPHPPVSFLSPLHSRPSLSRLRVVVLPSWSSHWSLSW